MRQSDKGILPALCIFGPTAVGKTALLNRIKPDTIEIISVDSMQAYRHMDVGTAKPNQSLLKKLPHHLIDILDPNEQYNAGIFVDSADKEINDIYHRGRLPVLSGGTVFYFQSFLFGLPETPACDEKIRAAVALDIKTMGLGTLYNELKRADPVSASRLSASDTYRITRAVEVFRQTGRPLSSYTRSSKIRSNYSFLLIGLDRPRKELYERIDRRVELMFSMGLKDEFTELLRMGYGPEDPGMKAIGYREFFRMRESGCTTLEEIKKQIQQSSRRYAKRQITFFSKLPEVRWFHPDKVENIYECINTWLAGKRFDISIELL